MCSETANESTVEEGNAGAGQGFRSNLRNHENGGGLDLSRKSLIASNLVPVSPFRRPAPPPEAKPKNYSFDLKALDFIVPQRVKCPAVGNAVNAERQWRLVEDIVDLHAHGLESGTR